MSTRRLRGRKDATQDGIVKRLRELGCTVILTHDTGIAGWPDLVVGCAGVTHLVECKNLDTSYGRKGLNAYQSAFARDWRGERLWIVHSPDEATAVVMNWRKALR